MWKSRVNVCIQISSTKRNHSSKKIIRWTEYIILCQKISKGTKNYCHIPKGLRNQLERAPLWPYQEILNIKMCNIKSLKNPWLNTFIHYKKAFMKLCTKHRFQLWKYDSQSQESLGWGFPGGSVVKNPPANAGDTGLIPGPGRFHKLWSN